MLVNIQNYQIVEDAELDIPVGLSVLKGDNDTGKSAIVRAVFACLYNESGDGFIRDGSDQCEVSVQFDDLEIVWQKESGSGAEYRINGQHYTKIGRGSFDELMEKGFKPLDVGRDKFHLQFHRQLEPLILSGRPDTRKWDVLSSLFDQQKFNSAIQSMDADRREVRSDLQDVEAKLEERTDTLESKQQRKDLLDGFLEENDDKYQQLCEDVEKKDRLEELHENFQETKTSLQEITENVGVVSEGVDDLQQQIERVGSSFDKWSTLSECVDQKTKLENLIDLYTGAINQFEKEDFQGKLREVQELIDKYTLVSDYIRVKGKINDISAVVAKFDEGLFELIDYVKSLIADFSSLKPYVGRLQDTWDEFTGYRSQLEDVEARLDEEKENLENLENELDVCPVCGQQF